MKGHGGSIINLSSIEDIIGEPPVPAYNSSKGAVRIYTKSTALQCARQGHGIRVNSIHPGYVGTPLMVNALGSMPASEAAALKEELMKVRIPMGRPADPPEIAHGVVFPASDESSYMTGSVLVIDGGYTAK